MAAGAGTGEPEESLGVTRSTSLNRLVRTRMPGGVGRAVRDGRPYPMLAVFWSSLWVYALCPVVRPTAVGVLSPDSALIFLVTVDGSASFHICFRNVRKR